jgi:hypothetical protein
MGVAALSAATPSLAASATPAAAVPPVVIAAPSAATHSLAASTTPAAAAPPMVVAASYARVSISGPEVPLLALSPLPAIGILTGLIGLSAEMWTTLQGSLEFRFRYE